MKIRNSTLTNVLILVGLSYVFFILGNGILALTNPDEVFYIETAKEMVQHKSWMTPYLFGTPQFEKPILLYWLLRIAFLGTSVSSALTSSVSASSVPLYFDSTALTSAPAVGPAVSSTSTASYFSAASSPSVASAMRFFPALFAAIGVIAVYFFTRLGVRGERRPILLTDSGSGHHGSGSYGNNGGLGVANERKSLLSALVLVSAGLYIGLARTVYTDMIFSVLILLALASFFWGYTVAKRRRAGFLWFFVFSALAVLAKGPLGLAIPVLIVIAFLAIRRELRIFFSAHLAWGLLVFVLIALPWYIFVIQKYGHSFTHEFVYNVHIRRLFEAEHPQNDRWYFYAGSAIVGMFPWSIFVLISFVYLLRRLIRRNASPMHLLLACWILVTIAIFQPAHSKLISYIFPMFPALAIIVGDLMGDWVESKRRGTIYVFGATCCVTLAVIPIGLIVGATLFHEYVPSMPVVIGLIILFAAMLGTMVFLLARKKSLYCAYLLSASLPILLFSGLYFHRNIDPYLSSESACKYLVENNDVNSTILCSKYFARAVHYYTDKEIAVINVAGAPFFSPHPIPYFDSEEQVRSFLRSRPVTFCIVDAPGLRHLERIAGDEMNLEVQTKTGNEYVAWVSAER